MTLRLEDEARRVLPAHIADRVAADLRPHWRGARIYVRRNAIDVDATSALGRFVCDVRCAVYAAGGDDGHIRTLLLQLASAHVLV